eukprot:TRINITY_DN3726_c0_g1_i2.p1 TRINITY_DN3726_c0_g1~~TRINITY_DN3726_c0_g1_i2.p1  ORF type:complete len:912 (+),score=264.61 TRINITY_DN3726_c0_g1_i2:22-2757(+)
MEREDEVVYRDYYFYDILGVPRKEPDQYQIKKAFRTNIKAYQDQDQKLVDLCRAYHILCDPQLKAEYDKTGQYLLHLPTYWTFQRLAEEGEIHRLMEMLKEDPTKLNKKDKLKHTALYAAARANRVEVVEFLMERRADPDRQQKDGSTPLHAACYYGQVEMVKMLLEYGANPFIRNVGKATPIREIHLDHRRAIMEFAQPYLQPLSTPWLASKKGDLESLKKLIFEPEASLLQEVKELVAPVPINSRDKWQKTFLHCASETGNLEVVEWLIEQQADINARDLFDHTPLHLAARADKISVVDCLLKHRVDPSLIDSQNKTAEMLLKQKSSTKDLFDKLRVLNPKEMLDKGDTWWFKHFYSPIGAEIDARDSEGRTLLYCAAKDGQEEIVEILIEKKANLDLTQKSGSSPLHAASYYGHPNIVQSLLRVGANPSLKNGKGSTPVDEAGEAGTTRENRAAIIYHFKQYMNITEENPVPLFEVTCFERRNKNDKGKKIPLSLTSTFGEVMKVLDPDFVAPVIVSRFQKNNIPYRIFYGGRTIQVMSDLPVLQEISKARYSMSRFISFPIALEYEPATDKVYFTESRNILPPALELINKGRKVEISGKWKSELTTDNNFNVKFVSGLEEKVSFQVLDGSSLPNCVIAFSLESPSFNKSEQFTVEVAEIQNEGLQFNLYLYDIKSRCWYELSPPKVVGTKSKFVVPVPNGIYSIIHKEIILLTPSIQLQRDLLQDYNYKTTVPVKGTTFVKIRYELKVPSNFHEDDYFTAYHGTRSDRLASIVTNGLMVPNERNNAGTVVETKQETADPNLTHEGIPNWGFAIFLSLYEKYSRIPLYANPFKYIGKDKEYNDFDCHLYFEVKVDKTKPFTKHLNTTPVSSTFLSDEEKKTAEWRITDASSVFISAFVVVVRTKIVNQ